MALELLSKVPLERHKGITIVAAFRNQLQVLTNVEGVIGCILADHQGLCLGAKGNASGESAGLIAAIADEVAKLEPESQPPVIVLESDNRQCIIKRQGPIVGAIYKAISP